ncbi:MAG: hypothetical protein IJP45_00570 [Paludibacteraceae bacterium]|nr:hypothetical protein [Paludibacteraceae bacterium]
MKKIFTLAAAVLASFSLWAETIVLSEVTPEENWYEVAGVGRISNKSGSAFSDPDMSCEGITGFKTGSSYFTIQTYAALNGIVVTAQSTSNRTIKAVSVAEELSKSAPSESNVEFELIGSNESYAVPKNECGNEFTLNFKDGVAANSYIQIVFSGNAEIVAVEFNAGTVTPSTDPVATVTLSGDAEAYVGETVTVTASTDVKANAFQWLVNDAVQEGAEAAKFDFKADAAGTYSIVCKAKNDYNEDWVASAALAIVVSEKNVLEQVEISGSTVWDWSKAASVNEIKWTGDQKDAEPVLLANVEGMNNNEDFNSQALLFSGEYPVRNGNYCQGPRLIFKTTVAGKVSIEFSNTGGGDRPERFLAVNGVVEPSVGSASTSKVESAAVSVNAGEVKIEGSFAEYDPQYLRIYKVTFVAEGDATALINTDAEVKAVKVIRNGQLLIEKNGVLYNAQGNVVK